MRHAAARVTTGLALLLVAVGCAPTARAPKLTLVERAPIGIVAGESARTPTYRTPPRGAGAATRSGASLGVQAVLESGNLVAVLGAPIAAAIGAVEGVASARSAEEVDRAERGLRAGFAELRPAEALRDRTRALFEARTGRPVAVVDAPGGPPSAGGAEGEGPAGDRVRTVIELSVPAIGLRAGAHPVGNPAFQFVMVVRVRVTDSVAGSELFQGQLPYLGATAKFGEWGADDGRRFRVEAQRGIDRTAATIVEELFCVGADGSVCPGR